MGGQLIHPSGHCRNAAPPLISLGKRAVLRGGDGHRTSGDRFQYLVLARLAGEPDFQILTTTCGEALASVQRALDQLAHAGAHDARTVTPGQTTLH